jgi:hypothetical protein
MAKKKTIYKRVEDHSNTFERVDPKDAAFALGAEQFGSGGTGGSPFSVLALRSRLLTELVSTGGRPGRREATARKIPMTDAEWDALDEVTTLLKRDGVNATPGQVAGLLLHHSLTQVLRRLEAVTPLANRDSSTKLTNADLEETLENVLAAAASAEVHLEQLRPVAMELLQRMKAGKGAEAEDE